MISMPSRPLSTKEQAVLTALATERMLSSSEIFQIIKASDISERTTKRLLGSLKMLGYITVHGAARAVRYQISPLGRLFTPVDATVYGAKDMDTRGGKAQFAFDIFPAIPETAFSEDELSRLDAATALYHERTRGISASLQKKELERLIIELAWKSSRIEGNTYTLLDTERLIREQKEAPGHAKSEAAMILNHKDAFTFIVSQREMFTSLTAANIEKVHSLLVKDLDVEMGLRQKPVGITGSVYKPLDTRYQIEDALNDLSRAVGHAADAYTKALITLLGISYIQPFEDGNKRTARLMANAVLLAHGCAPLSYRSVSEDDYRNATLVFYERNSLIPFKDIFIGQYLFATEHYAVV
jgi:fido (protein-threonine AMPylation protein)